MCMLIMFSCTNDEPVPVEEQPGTEKRFFSKDDKYIFIPIEEAKAAGYQWLGPEHFSDSIYSCPEIDVVIPKDGTPVELNFKSMASLRYVHLRLGKNNTAFFKADYNEDLLKHCSTPDYYFFIPYHLTSYTGFEVIQEEPTKVIIKGDPKNMYAPYGYDLMFYRCGKSGLFDSRYIPRLKVYVTYEK